MTASVPSGFSRDELEKLLASAPTEGIKESTDSDEPRFGKQELTEAEMLEQAEYLVQESLDRCNTPVFHKAIVLVIISKMVAWHMNCSEDQSTDASRASWVRDAGKCQAIMDILTSICVGENDPFLA